MPRACGGIGGDVSDARIAESLVDQAAARLGGFDIVINNAGSMFGRTAIAKATDEQYRNVVDLNIGGVFFACRRAAAISRPAMVIASATIPSMV